MTRPDPALHPITTTRYIRARVHRHCEAGAGRDSACGGAQLKAVQAGDWRLALLSAARIAVALRWRRNGVLRHIADIDGCEPTV